MDAVRPRRARHTRTLATARNSGGQSRYFLDPSVTCDGNSAALMRDRVHGRGAPGMPVAPGLDAGALSARGMPAMSLPQILIVPGLHGSGPSHWQSRWEA